MRALSLHMEGLQAGHGHRTVVEAPSMSASEGEIVLLAGANGSGKTTLLRTVGLLLPRRGGTLRIGGHAVDGEAAARRLRGEVVYVHQDPVLFRGTVRQNVAFAPAARRAPRAERPTRVGRALAQTGLEGMEDRDVDRLSGGERKRVMLARALAAGAGLLLLDEPLENVDEETRRVFLDGLDRRFDSEVTVLVATHRPEEFDVVGATPWRIDAGRLAAGRTANAFRGVFRMEGVGTVFIGPGGVRVSVSPVQPEGSGRIAVDPARIILSAEAVRSSARNVLRGRVLSIADEGQEARVELSVAGPGGASVWVVRVTAQSRREMGLDLGGTSYLVFKATAVVAEPLGAHRFPMSPGFA